eukprot:gene12181-13438_t
MDNQYKLSSDEEFTSEDLFNDLINVADSLEESSNESQEKDDYCKKNSESSLSQGDTGSFASEDTSSRASSDSLKEDCCNGEDDDDDDDEIFRDHVEVPGPRLKSRTLLSSKSEIEFVNNYAKERQFARMSLERDKQPPVYSGYLSKLGGTGFTPKNWRKRWFVLRSDNCLYYYKNPRDSPVGAVVLSNYLVTTVLTKTNKKFAFHLTKGGARSYTFSASSEIEKKMWMKVISEAAKSSEQALASPESNIHNVSIPALSIKDPDCHGYLWKQGYSRKSWKKRYSVLKRGCLYYYQDMSETVALGVFNMHCYSIQEAESNGRKFAFTAVPPQPSMRTYYFSSESEHDRERWVKAMVDSIEHALKEEDDT